MSPSGKAHGFGPCIRGFESLHPSQIQELEYLIEFKLFYLQIIRDSFRKAGLFLCLK